MKCTFIAIVLDKSGSMKTCRLATIKGLNEQFATIRQEAQEPDMNTFVSFYTFNSKVDAKYKCQSVNFLEDIKEEDYITKGDTAMYDAVGQAIKDLEADTVKYPDSSYLVITVTDGEERCSQNFTKHQIAQLIKEKQDTGKWTFAYLGANQNLVYLAKGLNIPQGNVANYKSDNKGSETAWKYSNTQLNNFLKLRKRGTAQLKSFYSNNGNITDCETLELAAPVAEFDYKSLNLEAAKPNENSDLDSILGIKPEGNSIKSCFRKKS